MVFKTGGTKPHQISDLGQSNVPKEYGAPLARRVSPSLRFPRRATVPLTLLAFATLGLARWMTN